MKASRRPRLTPQLSRNIVASIRSGGYAHVAAQAWRVPPEVFDDWLRRGSRPRAREPYASFAQDVLEAQAQARLRAEIAAFAKDPKGWLNHGPGRESEDNPGWSAQVKAALVASEGNNPFLDPQLLALFQQVLSLLIPFPEARRQVAQALTERGLVTDCRAA
jgi:hypothetical protein